MTRQEGGETWFGVRSKNGGGGAAEKGGSCPQALHAHMRVGGKGMGIREVKDGPRRR